MNPFLAFILGGMFLGEKETKIIHIKELETPKLGRCNACPEYGLYREDLGFYADDFCYKLYKEHKNK